MKGKVKTNSLRLHHEMFTNLKLYHYSLNKSYNLHSTYCVLKIVLIVLMTVKEYILKLNISTVRNYLSTD